MNFVKHVEVTFEQPAALTGQSQHLVAIGRLKDGNKRFGMKGVGRHGKLRDGTLKFENSEEAFTAENRQTISAMFPEETIVSEFMKWISQMAELWPGRHSRMIHRGFLPGCGSGSVLLVFGKGPMCWLIERQKRRFPISQKLCQLGLMAQIHDTTSSISLSRSQGRTKSSRQGRRPPARGRCTYRARNRTVPLTNSLGHKGRGGKSESLRLDPSFIARQSLRELGQKCAP